jgi:threonine synthase
VPDGTPSEKREPIAAAGAQLRPVAGTYSDAHAEAKALAARTGWANLTTTYVNPFMLEGDNAEGGPVRAWERPHTAAGAIADPLAGYVADGDRTLAAIRHSGGAAIAVEDDEMARAAAALADRDDIAAELSAAAAAAALWRLRDDGRIAADDVTVLVLTAADRRV